LDGLRDSRPPLGTEDYLYDFKEYQLLPSPKSARRSNSLMERNVSFYPAPPIGGDRNRQRREELTSRHLTLRILRSLARPRVREVSRFTFRVLFFPDDFVFRLVLFSRVAGNHRDRTLYCVFCIVAGYHRILCFSCRYCVAGNHHTHFALT
jgi:hypothetical protein